MGTLRVIKAGMLTTVQDLGRPGFASMGVPTGGAADTLSLRIANRLVGNPDNAAGLEMTLIGDVLEFRDDALIAFAGVDADIEVNSTTCLVPICTRVTVRRGDRLYIGPFMRGVRIYLCIAGGINVPRVLDSASTLLSARFGGFQGRALSTGDEVTWNNPDAPIIPRVPPTTRSAVGAKTAMSQTLPLTHLTTSDTNASTQRPHIICEQIATQLNASLLARNTLRALDSAHVNEFDPAANDAFWNTPFKVSPRCDRVGVRLEPLGWQIADAKSAGRMPSMGMMHGAIQVPPGGEPIILMAEHPTTGGYPVIACVATVDLPKLGQLRPGETIRFSRVTRDEALQALHEQETVLDSLRCDA